MARKPKADAPPAVVAIDDRGQVSIHLDARYLLRPDVEAIMDAERETGLSLFDLASAAAHSRMRIDHMGIVVASLMRGQGRQCQPGDPLKSTYDASSPTALAGLIMEAGPARIMAALAIVLAGSINGGYTSSGETKPTR